MNDRQLLEAAAKAAGVIHNGWHDEKLDDGTDNCFPHKAGLDAGLNTWNPLTDDGDALRLAVKLGLRVQQYPIYRTPKHSAYAEIMCNAEESGESDVWFSECQTYRQNNDDPYAATRRAIVRAAAEIGGKP